ncbi:hypothetical protein [Roseobacter sp. A03A-229]
MKGLENLFFWNPQQTFPRVRLEEELLVEHRNDDYKSSLISISEEAGGFCSRELCEDIFLSFGISVPRQILHSGARSNTELLKKIGSFDSLRSLNPCVESWEMEDFRGRLARLTSFEETRFISSVGTTFYYNSRVGMRELLLSRKELRAAFPGSTVAHTPEQVSSLINNDAEMSVYVVKSNFSMGGVGSAIVSASTGFNLDMLGFDIDPNDNLLDTQREYSGSKVGSESWDWTHEPFVVENFVGDERTNKSLTFDGMMDSDGQFEFVGASEQILRDRKCYEGIKSFDFDCPATIDVCMSLIELVSSLLWTKGYVGPINIDFVRLSDGSIFLVDLNLRFSAPFPIHRLLQKILPNFRGGRVQYQFVEEFFCGRNDIKRVKEYFDGLRSEFPREFGPFLLASPVASESRTVTVPILFLDDSHDSIQNLIERIRRELA